MLSFQREHFFAKNDCRVSDKHSEKDCSILFARKYCEKDSFCSKSQNKIGFVFHHGWGFDKSYWKNLSPLFSDFPCEFFDVGYFKNPNIPTLNQEISWIGVGHSLGFGKLLEKVQLRTIYLKGIIGIQSFLNFVGNDAKLRKTRSIILEKTIDAFKKSPLEVLKQFRTGSQCFSDDYEIIDSDLLLQDLKILSTSFTIPNSLKYNIIYSHEDPIVDNQLIKDNFTDSNGMLKLVNCDNHGLGYHNAERVYHHIMEFVKESDL